MSIPQNIGKYNVQDVLGRGAMGTVYKCHDPAIEREVAIKAIIKSAMDAEELKHVIERFRHEARAVGRLVHPNIVQIYDYAEDDQLAYIVMELVNGPTLLEYLKTGFGNSIRERVNIVRQILKGIGHAHTQGVIHRDIKPSNILVSEQGDVKIADFGIARTEASNLTEAGDIVGTLYYMSPEQFMGEDVTAATDLYAIGVMAYELLTGRLPFSGNRAQVMQKVLNKIPENPSMLNLKLSPTVDRVLQRALAKNPSDRYQNADEFADDLRRAIEAVPNAVTGVSRNPQSAATETGKANAYELDAIPFESVTGKAGGTYTTRTKANRGVIGAAKPAVSGNATTAGKADPVVGAVSPEKVATNQVASANKSSAGIQADSAEKMAAREQPAKEQPVSPQKTGAANTFADKAQTLGAAKSPAGNESVAEEKSAASHPAGNGKTFSPAIKPVAKDKVASAKADDGEGSTAAAVAPGTAAPTNRGSTPAADPGSAILQAARLLNQGGGISFPVADTGTGSVAADGTLGKQQDATFLTMNTNVGSPSFDSNVRKGRVLFVDDEQRILSAMKALFRERYHVFTTTDCSKALEFVNKYAVHVIVSDQRMPEMQGVEFLRKSREISPNSVRILLTGYSDLASIVGSINDGEVYRFISKPWDNDELRATMGEAMTIALALADTKADNSDLPPQIDAGVMVIEKGGDMTRVVTELVGKNCPVVQAASVEDAIDFMQKKEIALVIADADIAPEQMRSMLKLLKQENPQILTIVVTSASDSEDVIELINQAQVFRFLNKPINVSLMRKHIHSALKRYIAFGKAPELTQTQKVQVVEQVRRTAFGQTVVSKVSSARARWRERAAAEARRRTGQA